MDPVRSDAVWYRSSGIIRYDPSRGTMKNRVRWWCVIECDNDIARYARYWVDKQNNPLAMPGKNLCQPSWGAHISVVRGEQPSPDLMPLWRQYQGVSVDFEYTLDVMQTGQNATRDEDHYWVVHVRCPLAMEIRQSLRLRTHHALHMTVGRTY